MRLAVKIDHMVEHTMLVALILEPVRLQVLPLLVQAPRPEPVNARVVVEANAVVTHSAAARTQHQP